MLQFYESTQKGGISPESHSPGFSRERKIDFPQKLKEKSPLKKKKGRKKKEKKHPCG